jgi:lincosamide nucleotidyltransferase A/C/D/E
VIEMRSMELEDALALCRIFEAAKLPFWVDGGWGVDALVMEQTRPHSDLDLAVFLSDLPAFERVLAKEGYTRIELNGEPDWNWVLRNASGLSVDLHGFVWDDQRNGILGDPANGEMYPSGAFDGRGRLGDLDVQCIAAPVALMFRNGFTPRAVDHHDVALLCDRFSLEIPSRFRKT